MREQGRGGRVREAKRAWPAETIAALRADAHAEREAGRITPDELRARLARIAFMDGQTV